MHPILIKISKLSIHSYGFMLALSFLLGIYLASYRAKKRGVDVQQILDLSIYIIIAAVVGSRLAYIVFHLEDYHSLLDVFALWQGGATLYGGLLLAILASYIFTVKRRADFLLLADTMSPSIALGVALTRIGCFLSGCCFGKATTLPWGVVFPPSSPAGLYARSLSPGTIALHPTQLYASLGNFAIFLLLMKLDRALAKKGSMFGALLLLYGIERFTVDVFRYYESNMIAFGLSLNQLLSILLMLIGIWLLLRKAPAVGERL
jgi:phosphatidylglycerol:prolipoprotein diacylglycerol transferase